MKDSDLLTVIVPIYKVEKYLRRCLDSIVDQTYRNLEIILVDDGSPDNCPVICNEYAAKDNRIKVIHQKNAGVSVARNAGLDAATGDYIAFVDSDDWLEPNMYQALYDALQESQADIACCGCYLEEGNVAKVLTVGEKGCNSVEEFLQGAITGQNHALIALWTKLYRRHIFDDVRFVEGIVSEDSVIAIDICAKQPKLVLTKKPYYHYNKENDVSLTCMKISPQEGYGKFLWLTKWLNLPADFHTDAVVNVAKKKRLKFALRAYEMNYVKPTLSEERVNEIVKFLDNADNYNDVSSHMFLCWCFRNCRWVVNMFAKVRYGEK